MESSFYPSGASGLPCYLDQLYGVGSLLERILEEQREKWTGKRYKGPAPLDKEKLPALPANWEWATLEQLGELNRGKSKHRPRNDSALYGGAYPFVQTGDIRQAGTVIRNYQSTYNEKGLEQSRLWPEGTLCITIAANIAETAILGFDACFPDSVVGFLPHQEHCSVGFVEYFIRTAKEDLDRYAPATAQKNINLQTLRLVTVPLPPLKEQFVIVDEVERRLSTLAVLEGTIEESIKRSEGLRQSILKRAFSGRLVEQDPSDEPASILLERIREEQHAAEQKGKKSKSKKTEAKEESSLLPEPEE